MKKNMQEKEKKQYIRSFEQRSVNRSRNVAVTCFLLNEIINKYINIFSGFHLFKLLLPLVSDQLCLHLPISR